MTLGVMQLFLITLMPFGIRKRAILMSRTVYKTSLMAMMNVKLNMLMKTSMGFNYICLILWKGVRQQTDP